MRELPEEFLIRGNSRQVSGFSEKEMTAAAYSFEGQIPGFVIEVAGIVIAIVLVAIGIFLLKVKS